MKIKKGKQFLFVKLASEKMPVDREKGIISDVSIITEGEAQGHGFLVDKTMSDQVLLAMQKQINNGTLSFYKHESWTKDYEQLGTKLGRMKNAYRDGGKIRADFHFSKGADKLPGLGNVRGWLEDEVEDDPTALGLSIAFFFDIPEMEKYQEDNPTMPLVGRLKSLESVDWVGKGAANPDGLFSENTQTNNQIMEDEEMKIRAYLISLGMNKDATEEEAEAYIKTLSVEKLAEVKRLAALSVEPKKSEKPEEKPEEKKDEDWVPIPDDEMKRLAVVVEKTRKDELERQTLITALSEKYKFSEEWTKTHKEGKTTLSEIKLSAFDEQEKGNPNVIVGADRQAEGSLKTFSDAIMLKVGRHKIGVTDEYTKQPIRDTEGKVTYREPIREAFRLKTQRLTTIFKEYYRSLGAVDIDRYNDRQIGGFIFNPRSVPRELLAMSTSDFDCILQDAMNKSLLQAYDEAPSQWPKFVEKITAPDFNTIHAIRMSSVGNLTTHDEGQELTYSSMSDAEETFVLETYKKGLSLTERALIQDDMSAFTRIPIAMGAAARRAEDAAVVAVFNNNANMADGIALFQAATHKNFSAAAAVISEVTLTAAELAIRIQTGLAGQTLDLFPRFLIVPPAIKRTAMQVMQSGTSLVLTSHGDNTFQGDYEIIDLPGLSSASEWYLSCNYATGSVSTIQLAFLAGSENPVYETELDFNTDGRRFKIKHYLAAKAVDWRGMYKNGA